MSAILSVTLEVRVVTQKNDKVAVTGAQTFLGAWDPAKIVFLRPRKDSDVWFVTLKIPFSCEKLDYRYLVCRKVSSAHGDEVGDETHIIRHWEAGLHCRHKTIAEMGAGPSIDTYGLFEPNSKMFIDQGWLIDETEIQLRFYKDPIRMFKKRDQADVYNVKCSTVRLFHEISAHQASCNTDDCSSPAEEFFDQVVHSSNPLIRVSSLGHYRNKEQLEYGMPISSDSYVTYKLRTFEFDCHGIKVDFYRADSIESGQPVFLGYTNILSLHMEDGAGSIVLALNGTQGYPVGQVTIDYLVCKPTVHQRYSLDKSFTRWWSHNRLTLDIGHRGLGNTHHSDINSAPSKNDDLKHENTLSSLITAGHSGADFVEFDVMLSKDMVPVIWHDFNVSILLRKRMKGHHRVYHLPVHELSLSQLKDLRVDFVRENRESEHSDAQETGEDVSERDNACASVFPTLKEALDIVDDYVGFYVELKYPQRRYGTKAIEENLDSYFERNAYLDPILKVLHDHARRRRIVLASFDADICIMARIKQNRYPVIMLVEDFGSDLPFYQDVRTHSVTTAVSLAQSEKFLGLSINAASLLRDELKLLRYVLDEELICFVWGAEANEADIRDTLRKEKVHAICHDDIKSKGTKSILRAEHEEKLSRLTNGYNEFSDSGDSQSSDELSPKDNELSQHQQYKVNSEEVRGKVSSACSENDNYLTGVKDDCTTHKLNGSSSENYSDFY